MTREYTIETPRLLLRELAATDFEAVHAYASKAEVVQFQQWGPNDEAQTRQFLREAVEEQSQTPRRKYQFGIWLRSSDRLIGGCGIYVKKDNPSCASIGYILHPDFWNQGFATEASRALIRYADETLQLLRIQATCDIENVGSRRVLEKAGLTKIDLLKDHVVQKGKSRSSYLFEVLF